MLWSCLSCTVACRDEDVQHTSAAALPTQTRPSLFRMLASTATAAEKLCRWRPARLRAIRLPVTRQVFNLGCVDVGDEMFRLFNPNAPKPGRCDASADDAGASDCG
jgi:hypothetical protein